MLFKLVFILSYFEFGCFFFRVYGFTIWVPTPTHPSILFLSYQVWEQVWEQVERRSVSRLAPAYFGCRSAIRSHFGCRSAIRSPIPSLLHHLGLGSLTPLPADGLRFDWLNYWSDFPKKIVFSYDLAFAGLESFTFGNSSWECNLHVGTTYCTFSYFFLCVGVLQNKVIINSWAVLDSQC